MRVAGITARGEPVEILEVDELAPPAADEVVIDVAAAGIVKKLAQRGSCQPSSRFETNPGTKTMSFAPSPTT
jgi:hypothetical protein